MSGVLMKYGTLRIIEHRRWVLHTYILLAESRTIMTVESPGSKLLGRLKIRASSIFLVLAILAILPVVTVLPSSLLHQSLTT